MTKFVILSSARCGSNMLASMLDAHPQVRCHGEAFNPQYGRGYIRWIRQRKFHRILDKYLRDYAIEKYLDMMLAEDDGKGCDAIGFKIMYPGQFDRGKILRHYLYVNKCKVVRMVRANLLRRHVSYEIASVDKAWSTGSKREQIATIQLDVDRLCLALERLESMDASIAALAYDFRAIDVAYEDLAADPSAILAAVFEHLGVDPGPATEVRPKTERQNPSKLADMIVNFDEVAELLKGTQWENCLEG